ncbi:MAG: phosphoribosylanthranilate isomerase [Deltaproteobacteria bacterium]|nr:phosphoribosylanthranilate isomerase [Deltaproteobacteria bacterium]
MTKVKLCGITNREDALAAVSLGVDAVGFVFCLQSPRYISPDEAMRIREAVPLFTACIGVFVNEKRETVLRIAEQCRLDGLQFHGNESPDYCSYFYRYNVIKAFPQKGRAALKTIKNYSVRAILIDAADPVLIGGSGKKADWELAKNAKRFGLVILAGGLSEKNVEEAVRIVAPYAVDLSSGVEVSPGMKDHTKMKRFMGKVREIDRLIMAEGEERCRCQGARGINRQDD